MISVYQLAEIISRNSHRMGTKMDPDAVRAKLGEESGQFLQAIASEIWQLGYDAGKPQKLSVEQKCSLFDTVQGRGTMSTIEATERAIHAALPGETDED